MKAMTPTRLTICAASLVLLSAASAQAEPAYATSNVNLRSGASTSDEIVGKIPAGSRLDATNCSEWCEVEWQGKKGYAIATALDRSGRAPPPRIAARRVPRPGAEIVDEDEYVPMGPPVGYVAPVPYYGYGYRPYYGYGYGYGYRGYRRW
jgi:uncharacterized protein YraI